MYQQIIQINFQFNISAEDFEKASIAVAIRFNSIPGLQWKTWLLNKETSEAGGIYLFRNRKTADDFLHSDFFKRIYDNPLFSNVSIKQFDIIENPSLITNAPLGIPVSSFKV